MADPEEPDGLRELLTIASNLSSSWAPSAVLSMSRTYSEQSSSPRLTLFECDSSLLNCSKFYNMSSLTINETDSANQSPVDYANDPLGDSGSNGSQAATTGGPVSLSNMTTAAILVTPDLTIYHPGLALLLAFVCFLVIFGNMLVMVAIKRERHLHTVTNYFVASLAAADCIVGLVVMPFSVVHEVYNKWWLFGQDWCDLWHSLDVLASTASILNLCVISLDRYWAITDPISYPAKMTAKRAKVLIAVVWTCAGLISFPAILWWRAVSPAAILYQCSFTDDLGYLIFSSIISFYGPLMVMLFVYYRIYKAAVQQARSINLGSKCVQSATEQGMVVLRMHRGGNILNSGPSGLLNNGNAGKPVGDNLPEDHRHDHGCQSGRDGSVPKGTGSGSASSDRNRNNHNMKHWNLSKKLAKLSKETKAAKTLGIVMGVFILCWLPFFVTNILMGLCRHCISDPDLVGSIVTWLGWLNSGMNPVIYACWSRDFRRAFEKILCATCLRRRRERLRRQKTFARYVASQGSVSSVISARAAKMAPSGGQDCAMREPVMAATRTSVSAIAVAEVLDL
ncbi:Dopamine receptor 2 [Halotydeus destructor]|nr:Dopamine receptor 2 [Halotydeus destructor]